MTRALPTILLLSALAACATPRGSTDSAVHHVDVVADPPRINTQVITGFSFAVEEKHIAMSAPGNAVGFSFSVSTPDCLRGSMNDNLIEFCKSAPVEGDKAGAQRWRAATSQRTFTTLLDGDSHVLEVEAGRIRGLFALGEGPGIEELRRNPALLGMAFAFGFVPAAKNTPDEEIREFKFKVSEAP